MSIIKLRANAQTRERFIKLLNFISNLSSMKQARAVKNWNASGAAETNCLILNIEMKEGERLLVE